MVLLTYKLKKKFLRRFFPFTAVNNVTFGVKAGQCFGLLGVNGAGKSTTFKMLTAALLPTEGETMIMNKKLSTNKREVNKYKIKNFCLGFYFERNIAEQF